MNFWHIYFHCVTCLAAPAPALDLFGLGNSTSTSSLSTTDGAPLDLFGLGTAKNAVGLYHTYQIFHLTFRLIFTLQCVQMFIPVNDVEKEADT